MSTTTATTTAVELVAAYRTAVAASDDLARDMAADALFAHSDLLPYMLKDEVTFARLEVKHGELGEAKRAREYMNLLANTRAAIVDELAQLRG
jgi:hypothetical protein